MARKKVPSSSRTSSNAENISEESELAEQDLENELESEIEILAQQEKEEPALPLVPSTPASVALVKAKREWTPRDALQQYMREVEKHPLLSREEEHELAVRFRDTGDVDAAYRLVTANLRLVVKIAHEYHRTAFSLLDLIQEGNVGLMHAIKKYDPYRGVKLSSYSAWWIRAYILRYVMENWRIVKLGTTQAQRKLFFNLRKEQAKLAAEGFDPSPKLLAERLQVSESDISEMDQRLGQDEFSLDAPIAGDDSSRASRSDRLVATGVPADEGLANHQLKEIMREKLVEFGETLSGKEKYIFEKRMVSDEPLTLQEIGNQYGITRERARQIEAKLVRELKNWLYEVVPDFKNLQVND